MTDRFVWTDIETFGLDSEVHPFIEIGFVITDLELNAMDTFHTLVWEDGLSDHWYKDLTKKAEKGDKDAEFVLNMHDKSGLWLEARADGIGFTAAEDDLHNWFDKHGIEGKDPLCGSSVGFDRSFFAAQMPAIEKRFHYRNIDISSVKELCARYNPRVYSKLNELTQPKKAHRSLSDLDDTIGEFRFYLNEFLIWQD